MVSEAFMRDFFGMKAKAERATYDWITVSAMPGAASNNHPSWVEPLFKEWIAEGWEVMSITVFPAPDSCWMCRAVGVLRRVNGTAEPS